jgi:DNA-binding NarL/FixJ family response regulator
MRALVLDTPALCRSCLASYLETQHIDVVGQASTLKDALVLVRKHKADIILLNVSLMVVDGFQLVREIKAAQPKCAILLLAMAASEEQIECALQLGANGYLVKDINPEELLNAMQRVWHGECVFPDGFLPTPMHHVAPPATSVGDAHALSCPLSEREIQVLEYLIGGLTDRAIAARLEVSEHTVKNHMKSIRHKLGVVNRVQASLRAIELGLCATPPLPTATLHRIG